VTLAVNVNHILLNYGIVVVDKKVLVNETDSALGGTEGKKWRFYIVVVLV